VLALQASLSFKAPNKALSYKILQHVPPVFEISGATGPSGAERTAVFFTRSGSYGAGLTLIMIWLARGTNLKGGQSTQALMKTTIANAVSVMPRNFVAFGGLLVLVM
jgi:hypothetical protein